MGIRVYCPNGHRLNLKSFLAGKRGICPRCGAKFEIPVSNAVQPGDMTGEEIAVLPAESEPGQSRENSSTAALGLANLEESFTVTPPRGDFDPAAIAAAAGDEPLRQDSPSFAAIGAPEQTAGSELDKRTAAAVAASFPDVAAASKATRRATTATARATTAPGEGAAGRPAGKETLSGTPRATWYVRHPVHGQFGPADDETLRQWVAEGRITDDTLVWRDGWADWRSAASLLSPVGAAPDAASGRAPSLATLDLNALAAASGAALTESGALGSPGQRASARRKSNQTMRIVSLALTIAVTLLTCLLIYVLTR